MSVASAGLLLALGAWSAPGPAAADSAIDRIREHYAAIERELPSYRCRDLELEGFSLEGGKLRACYSGGQLRKLTARHYGESGEAREDLYFWEGRLEFVFRVDVTYTALVPHPSRVRERIENRFYFVGGRLVRWLGPGRAPRSVTTADARREAAETLEIAGQLAACARDAARTVCTA